MDRSTVRATLAVLAPLGISLHLVFMEVAPRADGLRPSQDAPSPPAASGLFLSEVLFDPGRQDPKDPRTFRFNCSAPIDPTPNPNLRIIFWNVTGTVRLPERSPD